jgi:hypothetical protein
VALKYGITTCTILFSSVIIPCVETGADRVVAVPVEAEILEAQQLEDALCLPVYCTGLPFTRINKNSLN